MPEKTSRSIPESSPRRLTIEVWSDFVCPFCYIGKRHLEAGLERFDHRDQVDVVWKSFQLDPLRVTSPGQTIYEFLARKKGGTVAWAKQVSALVAERASALGLSYDFDRAVPANTFAAHQLAHLAAAHGLGDQAEERIMRAYFTDGLDIGDVQTLNRIAMEMGLDVDETRRSFEAHDYADAVRADQAEAEQIGISGVPFFLFDRRLAISGAQPIEMFERALQQTWATIMA